MGPDLTQILRSQHVEILTVVDAVGKSGHPSRAAIVQFLAAKPTLVSHLELEDDELYGAFLAVTDSDPRVEKVVATFQKEIELISEYALHFFEKYDSLKGSGDPDEQLIQSFAAEFKLLSKSLRSRIDREEHVLFPIYDRMLGGDQARPAAA